MSLKWCPPPLEAHFIIDKKYIDAIISLMNDRTPEQRMDAVRDRVKARSTPAGAPIDKMIVELRHAPWTPVEYPSDAEMVEASDLMAASIPVARSVLQRHPEWPPVSPPTQEEVTQAAEAFRSAMPGLD